MKRTIRLKESELRRMISESVRRILNEWNDRCFIADEGDGIYNIFLYDDFDEDGYYMEHEGEEGYHISDFDIVASFDSFEEAEEYLENELGQ